MPFEAGAGLAQMGRISIATLMLVCVLALPTLSSAQTQSSGASQAPAAESWQRDFDETCSKTQDAMSFTAEELKALVQKCDALQPQIEKLDDTRKKVYLRRLGQCRGLFAYVLDTKQKEKK